MKFFLEYEIFHELDLLMISTELLILECYLLFFDNNFVRIFTSIIFNYSLYAILLIVIYEQSILYTIINLGGSQLIRLAVYYFWCRQSKESFYYKEKLEIQTNWNNDILNHWNSGVIIYNHRKQKVKVINDYLKKFDEFQWKNTINEEIPINLNTNNILVGTEDREHNMLIVNNKNIIKEKKEYNSAILQQ